jgi:hypothetical protein
MATLPQRLFKDCNGGQVLKDESEKRDVNFQNCPQTEVKIINFIHFLPRPYQKLRE